MERLTLALLMLLCSACLEAQGQFRVVTWNVENLFDCRHDTLKDDHEFLPDSERRWTWGRYWRKITDVSRVVMGIGGLSAPALIGLCEVENDSVMIALTKRGALRTIGYDYVMSNSPDIRGVDVALMYQPSMFHMLGHETRRIPSQQHNLRPTRDLLHVWGVAQGSDTLHIVVCHLPSRAGGSRENKLNRRLAVGELRLLVDSLLANVHDCQLLVMGDFNATLRDKALKPITAHPSLTPLTPDKKRPTSGTYRYKGNWSWIDHMLVSPTLAKKATTANLYAEPWMKREMTDGTWYPRRTYLGTNYSGGVSDHVPAYIDLKF